MTFAQALAACGIRDGATLHPDRWADSQSAWTPGAPSVLDEAFLTEAAGRMHWPPDLLAAARVAATRWRPSEAHGRMLWHAHRLLAAGPGLRIEGDWVFPELGADAGLFPLLALLAGLPALIERWNRRGVSEEVQRATLADVVLWCGVFHAIHGRWGLDRVEWLRHHFAGVLFRLGRLQFMPGRMPDWAVAYRHRETGRVVLFCPKGALYDAHGIASWTGKPGDSPWTAELEEAWGHVRGHPIADRGVALRETVSLSLTEWRRVVGPGDPVLDIHIPAGEPLTPAAVRESVGRAREFFPVHVPEHPFRGFTCWAWLLDPTFQRVLDPDSNILAFQKLFHLFSVPTNDTHVMERIFGSLRPDAAQPPRPSRLRTAAQAFLDAGGRFTGDGGGLYREYLGG